MKDVTLGGCLDECRMIVSDGMISVNWYLNSLFTAGLRLLPCGHAAVISLGKHGKINPWCEKKIKMVCFLEG